MFDETKRFEERAARPSIHSAMRRVARGERILMMQRKLEQLGRGLLPGIQTSLPTEERRTDARDESFHGVFLCMFHPSKNINRSSRVFRETKRIEGQPCGPSIHRAIDRKSTRLNSIH